MKQRNGQLKIKRVPLKDLHADPANVRRHGERNLEAIAASIKQFGQVEPLVVQKSTGKVVGGNARLQVLYHQNTKMADVVELDVDDTQAAALGIALNRTAELAEWDFGALTTLFKALESEVSLTDLGWEEAEIKRLISDLDIPESGGKEYDESAADDVPMAECPECGHRFPK